MLRFLQRLQALDQFIFGLINRRMHREYLHIWFNTVTHMGGARFTIITSLLAYLVPPQPWSRAGMQACVALALSHIPVAIAKKIYPRLRPYLTLPDTNTFRNPLTDHSFPSGHTTAIFSITVPFMLMQPMMTAILGPVALIVAVSRIYLGLHYPSDCLAGATIGTAVAAATVALWP